MNNLAYQYDEPWEEMLDGKILAMSPRPNVNHNIVCTNISRLFGNYLFGKSCIAFGDGTDVYLTENDRVIPDVMIVCNRDIIKRNGIHGAPDLVVEVLSPSTGKNDKGYKKRIYEKCGVKEYWIVDPRFKSIEVYVLEDGHYNIYGIYSHYEDEELIEMDNDEKLEVVYTFKTSLFNDLTISIEDVFDKTL